MVVGPVFSLCCRCFTCYLICCCRVCPRHPSYHHSQQVMAGFRQEDVELYYEMGEELGRYELCFILLTSTLDDECLRQLEIF